MNTDNQKTSHPIPKKLANTVKIIQLISKRQARKLAIKLFFTPIKYATPELEIAYKSGSILSRETVNNKPITVYHAGISERKVLLVHGWSGRATQFYKIAPALQEAGFKVYSFTAPGHGSSSGSQTDLLEFTDCIKYLDKQHGPFEALVGHSLGANAAMVAVNQGLKAKKIAVLGAPGPLKELVALFCKNLGFNTDVENHLTTYIAKRYGDDYEEFSVPELAKKTTIPGLIIHDQDDKDAPVEHARRTHKLWRKSEFFETKGLGHRFILQDKSVINKLTTFLK